MRRAQSQNLVVPLAPNLHLPPFTLRTRVYRTEIFSMRTRKKESVAVREASDRRAGGRRGVEGDKGAGPLSWTNKSIF